MHQAQHDPDQRHADRHRHRSEIAQQVPHRRHGEGVVLEGEVQPRDGAGITGGRLGGPHESRHEGADRARHDRRRAGRLVHAVELVGARGDHRQRPRRLEALHGAIAQVGGVVRAALDRPSQRRHQVLAAPGGAGRGRRAGTVGQPGALLTVGRSHDGAHGEGAPGRQQHPGGDTPRDRRPDDGGDEHEHQHPGGEHRPALGQAGRDQRHTAQHGTGRHDPAPRRRRPPQQVHPHERHADDGDGLHVRRQRRHLLARRRLVPDLAGEQRHRRDPQTGDGEHRRRRQRAARRPVAGREPPRQPRAGAHQTGQRRPQRQRTEADQRPQLGRQQGCRRVGHQVEVVRAEPPESQAHPAEAEHREPEHPAGEHQRVGQRRAIAAPVGQPQRHQGHGADAERGGGHCRVLDRADPHQHRQRGRRPCPARQHRHRRQQRRAWRAAARTHHDPDGVVARRNRRGVAHRSAAAAGRSQARPRTVS